MKNIKLRWKKTNTETESNGCGGEHHYGLFCLQFSMDGKNWEDIPVIGENNKEIKSYVLEIRN
jgi:hypothetical protein